MFFELRDDLYDKFKKYGTLNTDGRSFRGSIYFPLHASANWMRALAIMVENYSKKEYMDIFSSVKPRKSITNKEKNTIYEQLVFALHQYSAINTLSCIESRTDVVRVATVAWYYGIYAASLAMNVAYCGAVYKNHTDNANAWCTNFINQIHISFPFKLHLISLRDDIVKQELEKLGWTGEYKLSSQKPENEDDVQKAVLAYFSGCLNWWQTKKECELKRSKEFKCLNVNDFRKKTARELRDKYLNKSQIGFMHQAIRFRGKANYRDSLYLGYGGQVESVTEDYLRDLNSVARSFTSMAGIYCSIRMSKSDWNFFFDDIESNKSFSMSPCDVWQKR